MNIKRIVPGVLAGVFALSVCAGLPSVPAESEVTASAATAPVYTFNYGGGITWPPEDAFPAFAPAKDDEVIDIIEANQMTAEMKYAMVTLQGLVNRERAHLILSTGTPSRDKWVNRILREQGKFETANRMNVDKDIINKYKSYIKGMVVYNEYNQASKNVATAVAGAEDCIAVSSSLASAYGAFCGLKIKVDLRGKFGPGREEAYNWLYNNYYKNGRLNKRLLVTLSPEAHQTFTRDIAVATKSAVLWLDPTIDSERAVLDKFFDQATPGVTMNLGWWPDEDPGVVYATRKGAPTVPADYFENMTFHASQSREVNLPTVPEKPELKNKMYVALAFADGDNTQYNQGAMCDMWGNKNRLKYPINWTASPALYYVAPHMLNYYHETADTNMLICGPSGLGYTKATRWREKPGFLNQYAAVTNRAFEKSGINIVTIWDRVPQGAYAQFAANVPSLLGATVNNNDWNDIDRSNPDSMFHNGLFLHYPENTTVAYESDRPIFGLGGKSAYVDNVGMVKSDIMGKMANYRQDKPLFLFEQFVPWEHRDDKGNVLNDLNSVVNMADELKALYGDDIEFVRADHFFMLMNEYNNKPYNIALHAKPVASTAAAGAKGGKALDGSATTGWKAEEGNGSWLKVDLGERCEISRYAVKNDETGYAPASANNKAFRFQYSLDGETWVTADTVTNNTKANVYRSFSNTIAARYVKVLIDDAGEDNIAAIQELEVYGTKLGITDDSAPVTVTRVGLSAAKSIINTGDKLATAFKVSPMNAANDQLSFVSSNAACASVDANGVITAGKPGKVTITAKAKDGSGKSASITLTVRSGLVENLTLNAKNRTLNIGKKFTVKATVLPDTARNRAVSFKSSDPKVAKVTQSGVITAVNSGKATVTVRAKDSSGKSAKITITVRPNRVSKPTVKKKNGKLTVKYKKTKGAQKYQIYMKKGKGKFKKLALVKKTSYTTKKLKKKIKYSFRVSAVKVYKGKKIAGKLSKASKAVKM